MSTFWLCGFGSRTQLNYAENDVIPRHHFLVEEVVVFLGSDDTSKVDLIFVDRKSTVRIVENYFDVGRNDARTWRQKNEKKNTAEITDIQTSESDCLLFRSLVKIGLSVATGHLN